MSLRLVVRPEAEAEFLEAQVWYESRREGLGARFAEAVDASMARVLAAPLAFARVRGDIRRSLILTFLVEPVLRREVGAFGVTRHL